MSKLINCECGYVVRGETEDELVARAREHIEANHPALAPSLDRQAILAMSEEEGG